MPNHIGWLLQAALALEVCIRGDINGDPVPVPHIETNMDEDVWLLLKTVPPRFHSEVLDFLQSEGICDTVLKVVEEYWSVKDRNEAQLALETRDDQSPFTQMLMNYYGVEEHFQQVYTHKEYLNKSFQRLGSYFPHVTKEQIELHDLSKYSFEQAVGYTARWVHGVDWKNSAWQSALEHHYRHEPHHPEFYYPETDRMAESYLEESVLDMVASRWERQLNGSDEITNYELVNFDPKFLTRYNAYDRDKVEKLIERVQKNQVNKAENVQVCTIVNYWTFILSLYTAIFSLP